MEELAEEQSLIVAVSADAALELEHEGLADRLPAFRGPALDAVMVIGTDAATMVTLVQAPEAIRAFVRWIHDRCVRSGTSIEINIRHGEQRLRVAADGIAPEKVADLIVAALKEGDN